MVMVGRVVAESSPRTATGEFTAFDEHFAALRRRLPAIGRGLVGADEAEDLVHDTYLRARSRFQQLRDPHLFDAWVCRIAVNLCFNRHRRRRALLVWVIGRSAAAPERHGRDVGLRELIESLAPRDRTVVVLHYGHGYQTDEIATMLSLTSTNVRTILFRARARLAEALGEAER
jgi:RNA polymerase sigma factor (sigma-70 family)